MARNKKTQKNKAREAMAKAARRHPKNDTTPKTIYLPEDVIEAAAAINESIADNPVAPKSPINSDASNDLLEAANMNKTSDQATDDLTINTQSADDPPPVVSYDGPDTADDIIVDEPVRTKTNEELCAESILAAKEGEEDPAEVKISEWSLDFIRDGAIDLGQIVKEKWAALNSWAATTYVAVKLSLNEATAKTLAWSVRQTEALSVQRAKWFPKMMSRADFLEVIQVLVESEQEHCDYIVRLTKRIESLEKAVQGTAPRTVSADKLFDLLEAYSSGQRAKAATMFKSLSGATLASATKAVEAVEPTVN